MTTFEKGDTVRVNSFLAKIGYDNGGGRYDLQEDDGTITEYVPVKHLALVKRATPEQPPVGEVIFYAAPNPYTNAARYIRTMRGWTQLRDGLPGTSLYPWDNFDPTRVHLMEKSSTPLRAKS